MKSCALRSVSKSIFGRMQSGHITRRFGFMARSFLVHDGDDGYAKSLGDGLDGWHGLCIAAQAPHMVEDGECHVVFRGEVGEPSVQPVERQSLGVVDVEWGIIQAGQFLVEQGPFRVTEPAAFDLLQNPFPVFPAGASAFPARVFLQGAGQVRHRCRWRCPQGHAPPSGFPAVFYMPPS